MVRETPSATPVPLPKLDRMSRRTTPLSVSTSGPFEPSPGYGPAVSSGIAVVIVEAAPDVVVDDAPVPAPAPFFEPHAATIAATPATAEHLEGATAVEDPPQVEREPAVVVMRFVVDQVVHGTSTS